MPDHVVLGVHITKRMTLAAEVQRAFTEHGTCIKTRVGLHDVGPEGSSGSGVVLLELIGPAQDHDALAAKLAAIPGVEVQRMVFRHAGG